MTDPIADMLIRIKNGYMARRAEVAVPYSKMKVSLAKLLSRYHYIGDVSPEAKRMFTVKLHYRAGVPAMTDVKRMSKPGLRRYTGVKDLERIQGGLGFTILSTPKGMMTHVEARKERLGGEVICRIW
jgi:small subunit ribosomal protein S8